MTQKKQKTSKCFMQQNTLTPLSNYEQTYCNNKSSGTKIVFSNKHDYKNTKITETPLMTLKQQLSKISIKREHHILHHFANQI